MTTIQPQQCADNNTDTATIDNKTSAASKKTMGTGERIHKMADKSVSTEDLPMYSPPTRTTMSPIVANELLRLEAALNAVMAVTSPTEEEEQEQQMMVRRPRSHSHHHCYQVTSMHPRRSQRSASAIVLQHGAHHAFQHGDQSFQHGAHHPFHQHHHHHHHHGGSPGPSTMSSGFSSRPRVDSEHLVLPIEVELTQQGSIERKKRKRKRKKSVAAAAAAKKVQVSIVDRDELPKRARWTIVATACLLLLMCFLLVGITLRMAPIIDEMGAKRRDADPRRSIKRKGSKASERGRGSCRRSSRSNSVRSSSSAAKQDEASLSPKERRRRRIVVAVLVTFAFLALSSVLVVVVTLTQATFHSLNVHMPQHVRKENEQLMNSLNRAAVYEVTPAPEIILGLNSTPSSEGVNNSSTDSSSSSLVQSGNTVVNLTMIPP